MKNSQRSIISRRDFLKGTAAGALSIAAAGMLSACCGGTDTGADSSAAADSTAATAAAGTYIPGTYSATAKGTGTVTVTMTFDAESITDVQIDVSGEPPDIGGKYKEELEEMLLTAQSAEIDSISGATVTSSAVKEAAA